MGSKHIAKSMICDCKDGYSAYANKLLRKWYGYDIPTVRLRGGVWTYAPGYSHLSAWAYNLEECDIDALWAAGRLRYFESKPNPETVNRILQDPVESIRFGFTIREAMFCCIKARCEAAGQPLICPHQASN